MPLGKNPVSAWCVWQNVGQEILTEPVADCYLKIWAYKINLGATMTLGGSEILLLVILILVIWGFVILVRKITK